MRHRVLVRRGVVREGRALEACDVACIAVGIAALSVAAVGGRAAGLGCAQPIQGVVAEALRLAPAIRRCIADREHVAYVVVGVADVLQVGVGGRVAGLQAHQPEVLGRGVGVQLFHHPGRAAQPAFRHLAEILKVFYY